MRLANGNNFALPSMAVASIVIASILSNAWTLADRIALGGFSPIDWVNHLLLPENFTSDFKNGMEAYRFSFFMNLYPALTRWFGIPVETAIYFVLGFEVVALSAAAAYFARILLPGASPLVPAIVALIMVASSLGMADLSRISTKPYFAGLYYNVAEVGRLLAIAFVLRRHWWLAAGALAFSIATHPIMGALGAFFIAVGFLLVPGQKRDQTALPASILCVVLAGAWVIGGVGLTAQLTGGQIPRDVWVAYTTALNYHWYPYAYGMLTDFHGQHLLPLLGYAVLFYRYLPDRGLPVEIERAWRWGISSLLVLSAAGVAFSVWLPEPFLIKLNLQRASALVLWLGLPIVAAGLLQDVTKGWWLGRVAAGALLLSPFLAGVVVPTIAVLIVAAPPALNIARRWGSAGAGERTACIAFFAVSLLLFWYVAFSGYFDTNRIYYTGALVAWKGGILLAISAWIVGRFLGQGRSKLVVMAAVALAAAFWIKEDYRVASVDHERAKAYRAVQDWARTSTPREALFFVDPLIMYGWRDYSQRSSFGNLREWLHTSWLYDSNVAYYHEGIKRFNELGIDPAPYLTLRPTSEKMTTFYTAVGRRFYELNDDWRMDLARRYGISFFVMGREKLQSTALARVFENEKFVVLDARLKPQ